MPVNRPADRDGNLAVIAECADGRCLCDPTLDQVNDVHRYLAARPFVVEVPEGFLARTRPLWSVVGPKGLKVRYYAFPSRGGWKSKPDMRPSRGKAIVAAVPGAL